MRLYLAGAENKSWMKAIIMAGGKSALYSYYYLCNDNGKKAGDFIIYAKQYLNNIFIDSGGFSAFTKQVTIDIDEYINWIKEYQDYISNYAVLDAIGDAKQTEKNQQYMESKGLTPIPCFHYGESFDILKEMVRNYKYIALGGMVPIARYYDVIYRFLSNCYSIIKDNCKVHGFGVTNLKIIEAFPFFSVDSTSWLSGSKRGEVFKFKNGKFETVITSSEKEAEGWSMKFTDESGRKKWMERVTQNAVETLKMEKYITELWQKRGVKW